MSVDTKAESIEKVSNYEDLREKIIYQVEHYFSDYNLPKDKFLQGKMKENDGWVDLDVLLTFNRLKSITTDKEVISKALKSSDHGLVELSEDNSKLRRNPNKPLPEAFKQQFIDKTVYVKGFPKEMTLDELIEFFKPFEVGCVKMRRFSFNREFKGSVFVLFESVDAAKKLRDTTGLKYKETELIVLMAQEYSDKKAAEKSLNPNKKQKTTESSQEKELSDLAKVEETLQKMDKKPGVFLVLTDLKKEYEITFQDIKELFNAKENKVAFVDIDEEQGKAVLRFAEENGAKKAAEEFVKEGKITIQEKELTAEFLEGEKETAQYRIQAALRVSRFENDRSNRKRAGQNRQQGYRGKGGKRSERGGRRNGDGGPSEKRTKLE